MATTPARDAVHRLLHERGPLTPVEVQQEMGYVSRNNADIHLRKLTSEGRAEKLRSVYRATTIPRTGPSPKAASCKAATLEGLRLAERELVDARSMPPYRAQLAAERALRHLRTGIEGLL